jgi:micrococcal nuclease
VQGQTVRLVRDQSNTDRFGRLLRYVYVGSRFVNAELVSGGWAEAVEYAPDRAQTAYFRQLEAEARSANRGCHPTGIFNDGSDTR